jgi:hypothetical protein
VGDIISRKIEAAQWGDAVVDRLAEWALDYILGETHQFVGLNFVNTQWTGLRDVEVELSLEPRCHHPTRPSAVRTGA